jgi:hypothetical protein
MQLQLQLCIDLTISSFPKTLEFWLVGSWKMFTIKFEQDMKFTKGTAKPHFRAPETGLWMATVESIRVCIGKN